MTASADGPLRKLFATIVAGDHTAASKMLRESPGLATAALREGATRQNAASHFLKEIGRHLVAGDTALHIAAAAYQESIANALIRAGAPVRAKNRHGATALHSASAGNPDAAHWNPHQQAATIQLLVEAGADPNGLDRRGVAPLHVAARTRCASAVRALLACGADAKLQNKAGSTAVRLAQLTTGRGGAGSPAAKEQQREILELLKMD